MRRRGLVHAGAWLAATAAAVTLSWFGVHTVLAGTVYDPPRTLPVAGDGSANDERPKSSSTHRPKPSPSTPPSPTTAPPPTEDDSDTSDTDEKAEDKQREHTRAPSAPSRQRPSQNGEHAGEVRGATVRGGRAVFDIRDDSASLVSATPEADWDMQVWESPEWIRVTFRNGETSSSLICRWDHSKPRIESFEE